MAQEIQLRGPLAGAPSCRHCIRYRDGRIEVAPTFGITLQDEYDRTMFVGLHASYHIYDVLSIGVWGGYGLIHQQTGLAGQIQSTLAEVDRNCEAGTAGAVCRSGSAVANIPRGEDFGRQVGQLNWIVSVPEVRIIPLRGKLALFQNIFVDTDFYIFAGLALVGLTERHDFDAQRDPNMPAASDADLRGSQTNCPRNGAMNPPANCRESTSRASRVAVTGTFGVGLNFFINHFISIAVEYRAFPFAWNTAGTDESTTARTCGGAGMTACSTFPDYAVDRDTTMMRNSGGRFLLDENDRSFHWNQMVNFYINVFLPFEPHVGQ
jgi:outer membrane beta-barrel protein